MSGAKSKRNCKYTKKLNKVKIYYIKVRAYIVHRCEKVYGNWSEIKKVKYYHLNVENMFCKNSDNIIWR